jgi:altronate dehydratase
MAFRHPKWDAKQSMERSLVRTSASVVPSDTASNGDGEVFTLPEPNTTGRASKMSNFFRPIQVFKRMLISVERLGQNSAESVKGVANQTEAIVRLNEMLAAAIANQTDVLIEQSKAIAAAIANQSDLMRHRLDALNRVMHEVRQIQKAQLAMQREASEAISELAAANPAVITASATAPAPLSPAPAPHASDTGRPTEP